MNDPLRQALKQLRLSGLLESLEVRLQEAASHHLNHAEFLELILQDELAVRSERLLNRRIKAAGFRELKTLEDFDWAFNPSVKKKQVFDLASGRFIREHLADPRRALAQVASVLKPGGLVWLSTPDCGGAWARVMGDADPMWLEGEHLQFFCQRSLRRLAADQGFKVTDYRLSRRFVGCMEVVLVSGPPPG